MRALLPSLLSSLALLFLVACGSDGGEGTPPDGADATSADTGADAGGGGDAQPDTAPPADAGLDAGLLPDAAPDAGADTAADTVADAAPDVATDAAPDGAADVEPPLPDHTFVYEARTKPTPWEDAPVLEEVPTFYRTTDGLPNLDVRALQWSGSMLVAGTAEGLFTYAVDLDRFVAWSAAGAEEVVALGADPWPGLVVARPHAVTRLRADEDPLVLEVPVGTVRDAAWGFSGGWVATDVGVGRFSGDPWTWELVRPDVDARAVVVAGQPERVWVATASGVHVSDGVTWDVLTAADGLLPDDDGRALEVLTDGRVLVATATGLAVTDGETATLVLAGREPGQLPTRDNIALAARGDLWAVGHAIGATVRTADGAHSDHYTSGRWVRAPRVNAVALGPNGERWLGTSAGLTRIDLVPRTLGEKADAMEAFLDAHMWRMDGFVSAEAWFTDAWAQTDGTRGDKDNDGLWTQMQVGAWALASGATGDPAYCAQARRAIATMLLQIDIPAVDFEAAGLGRGFVTRSLVRDDEGALFTEKATQSNWHLVHWTDGHDYYWKDDTSSDETTGHFFGYPLYYDLCADEEEKAAIADRTGALAAYIVAHDFRLIDLDGQQTSHGEWYPELLAIAVDGIPACFAAGHPFDDCVGAASGHGWLNGIQILGHMLAAWHMTGDRQFYDAYERLIREHRYDELVDFHEGILTVTQPAVANHSDHELAILAYFTLIRYEPDEARRARWIQSALAVYDRERPERNGLWALLIGAITAGAELDVAATAGTLHEIPLDVRKWPIDNSHRVDARRIANDRFGDPQFDRVFPYDELRTVWWNGNLYSVTEGGDPREAQCPMFYLLPYWGLRYYGALTAPMADAR